MREERVHRESVTQHSGTSESWTYVGSDDSFFSLENRAMLFPDIEDIQKGVDNPHLEIGAVDTVAPTNASPKVAPRDTEASLLSIPHKLVEPSERNMVRLCDCRMSGTASSTIILHISLKPKVGGSLTMVRDAYEIDLDVEAGRLELILGEEELAERRLEWKQPSKAERGYTRLYQEHVLQADDGCDLDFLRKA